MQGLGFSTAERVGSSWLEMVSNRSGAYITTYSDRAALCFLSSDRQSSCYICLALIEKKSPPADWQRQAGENLQWSSFGRRFLSSSLTPWQPALLCLLSLKTVLLQLRGQCLMTAGLRDENLYITVTTSQDVDGSLGRREKACTCLVRQERDRDAAKPHPNSLRHWAADSKAQHYCTPPAGLQSLKTPSLAALAGMGRASFSSTRSSSQLRQWATKSQRKGGKGELNEARHSTGGGEKEALLMSGTMTTCLGYAKLLPTLAYFLLWRDLNCDNRALLKKKNLRLQDRKSKHCWIKVKKASNITLRLVSCTIFSPCLLQYGADLPRIKSAFTCEILNKTDVSSLIFVSKCHLINSTEVCSSLQRHSNILISRAKIQGWLILLKSQP